MLDVTKPDFVKLRRELVENYIAARGARSELVLAAMRKQRECHLKFDINKGVLSWPPSVSKRPLEATSGKRKRVGDR